MPVCPNCGGEMEFNRDVRMYVCKDCGLMLSRAELDALKDKKYEEAVRSEEDMYEEYLEWWLKGGKK